MDEFRAKLKHFLAEAGPNRRLVIALLVLVAAVAFVISTLNSGNSGGARVISKSNLSEGSQSSVISKPSFYVHIVGEVESPGVYELEVGSRLFDAVVAAGGFLKTAEQSSVNLARELTDGEQINILKVGQVSAGVGGSKSSLISLNRATQAELETLPGVGPALAGRMIDWRTANGGFKKKEDLLNVSGIGDKLFAGLSKLISL